VFDDQPKVIVHDIPLHTRIYNSSDISKLKKFLKESHGQGLVGKTYLYEAMLAGMDIIRKMPAEDNKFLVVFSDGEDLNSAVPPAIIKNKAEGIENLEVFCVDYMPGPKLNRFLASFSENHNGRIWKATSSSELSPIFKAFTSTLLYRYLISYRLPDPVIVEPAGFNFDILTMVDGSAVKNYIFFETGQSEIPADYALFKDKSEVASFDATLLNNAWDKYLNILNIVGQELSRQSSVRITITGCNANIGTEKDNLDLARRRAEAASAYLSEGQGDLEPAYSLMIKDIDLSQISSSKAVTADIEVTDLKGQSLIVTAEAAVQFIKREARLAQKKGYRVLEKYALILFDFNRSDIQAHNKEIVDRIVDRIKEIPTAKVSIIGHTDSIGNQDYNVALSIKRARAAYDQILAGGIPQGENLTYAGTGPLNPLFDNELPEGRALNRTVTVTLEYEQE
jgi:outer membrane protein OmpA-like peptidoglycan-associated protein